jgi:type VI protein secretion system component VasK
MPKLPGLPTPPPLPQGLFARLKSPKVLLSILGVLLFALYLFCAWYFFDRLLMALLLGLGLVLIALIVVLMRMVFSREREDRLGRGIHDREMLAAYQRAEQLQAQAGDLEDSFRRALAELQASRLGREGAQALPWYLVLGETGAGKSEALRRSGLDVPPEYARARAGGPTRHCDFFFTNQAILLDTAGRFAESESPEVGQEWRRLLDLIRRSRPGLPLDGVIVALPVPSLLSQGPQELAERGHLLRRRINELTDVLRVDVPIYVLVTKSDLLSGFVELVRALPLERAREAFGWTNDRRRFADAGELLQAAVGELKQRLELLLPEILMREVDPRRRRCAFLFPQQLEELSEPVAVFLRAAFGPSIYGEVPFLRGVYFASARREGMTLSPVLRRLGHDWANTLVDADVQPEQGIFLSDLFREIALGDRDLALPAAGMGRRSRLAAVLATAAIALVAMGLLGAAFVENLFGVRRLAKESALVVQGASSLDAIERLREAIESVSRDGRSVQGMPLRGFGLGGGLDAASRRAQETFVWAFGREFEEPAKQRLLAEVKSYAGSSFQALAALALDVAWLGSRAGGQDASRPDLLRYAPVRGEASSTAFRDSYDAFVRWLPERDVETRIEREREVVNSAATRLLDLARVESWASETRQPVRYADFGIDASGDAAGEQVEPAYTRDVWQSLLATLVAGVESTGGASSSYLAGFRESYTSNFDRSWRGFLLGAPVQARPRAEVTRSPYLELLARIDDETQASLPRTQPTPDWIGLLREVRRSQPASEEEKLAPWQRYQAALAQAETEIAPALENGEQALSLSQKMRDPQGTAVGTGLALVRELVPTGRDPHASAKLRELLALPILEGAAAVFERALSELDQRWKSSVAQPSAGALDAQGLAALYQPSGGALARFFDEGAGQFFADGRATPILGERGLAFGPSFRAWTEHARQMQRALYPGGGGVGAPRIAVRLAGRPTVKVGGSDLFVTHRDLQLACQDGVQTLVYREGASVPFTFNWTPECQNVSLRVFARGGSSPERELTPRREWKGPLAFPQWLQEAQRTADGGLQWRLTYGEVELLVEYRLQAGDAIFEIAHRSPPSSLRN